jgi:hypothetical protein
MTDYWTVVGTDNRSIHTDRDCTALNADTEVREATADEAEHHPLCAYCDGSYTHTSAQSDYAHLIYGRESGEATSDDAGAGQ